MLLHCWLCSLQGTRIDNRHLSPTLVAEIIENKIKLPLKADMFRVYDPDKRGLPDWPVSDEWDHMLHRNHLPWEMTYDEQITVNRAARGGPERLFTDIGWVTIDSEGIVPDGGRDIVLPMNYGDAAEIPEQKAPVIKNKKDILELYCTICGEGPFKNKQQRGSHMRYEHKGEVKP